MRRPAFIAGASSGIGAATAQVLAAAGYPVALGARRAEVCEQLAAKITADGGEAFAAPLDVADDNSVTAFVEAATSALGRTRGPGHQRRSRRAPANPRVQPRQNSPPKSSCTWSACNGWSRQSPPPW